MDVKSFDDRLSVKNITCCFTPKKECELIVSTGVVKLKVTNNSDSPKKKRKFKNKLIRKRFF
jgi:hypothetical protein